jgi:hypothetical protein
MKWSVMVCEAANSLPKDCAVTHIRLCLMYYEFVRRCLQFVRFVIAVQPRKFMTEKELLVLKWIS